MTSTNDIRRGFLDFFAREGHTIVPSAPLVPQNDPTLMFVNAGMVPFKNVFTGQESRPYSTATSSQKCVRAGGKHNDLDNVGYTARHHTFFEMLGNFSFGDYFKEQAIVNAWTLLTRDWGLSPDKLTATVYHTDDEAFDLWKKIAGLPDHRIIRIPTKDNFWTMGENGPCGPCSEIFYDHGDHIFGGPPGSPDEDGDRFVEIWNLVFMQYEQANNEIVGNLPKPSIDTGMGLERIAAVMQGVTDNYDTDTFKALIAASGSLTHTATDGANTASHRVIADHLRTAGFLVADGVLPANEGRGYVLRRIMRRAMRHAHILGAKEPLMHRLVPALVTEMGAAYPELFRAQSLIEATLQQEETRFRQTLDKGLKLLDEATADMTEGTLPGETAFKLYDTFGFPYDLTEDALRERGITVDREGFDTAMAEQKRAARAAWKGSGAKASDDIWFDIAETSGGTEFLGYASDTGEGAVVALVKNGARVDTATAGDNVSIVVNQTPFYGESGGQVGDAGQISNDAGLRATVSDTSKQLGRVFVHNATIDAGEIKIGDPVKLQIDVARRAQIRANHSATHLLHEALRERLGKHVAQKGSLVAPERLRFDFSQPVAMTPADIAQVESDVNAQVRGNGAVTTLLMTPDAAIEMGAMALFGEKYGDEVRVVSMGSQDDGRTYSIELCGGTHVSALGDIGLFKVVGEGAVSSGVRRVEALTGEAARAYLTGRDDRLREAAASLKSTPDEVPARVAALIEDRRRLERELAEAKKALAMGGGGGEAAGPEQVGGVAFIGQVLNDFEAKGLRGAVDEAKQRLGSGIAVMLAVNEGRASVAVGVTADLVATHNAVDLLKVAVAALGGQGGGGRPDMAQGGGPEGAKAADALAAVREALSKA
ncbi:alanine--tRNA ligase [Sphingomonas ginsenosidivorax]|uniref:Alanine--tRNA ligase n=1 Tax=Sphingomonas ginsenosidivorax TaxID=862135 RepID=A0A5C6UEQ3_9SPHN|nr:alanine--tRNA ligase [Sphingomonas ginsenosidivorax]TXC70870.1 alanine--tRNA ligase [Sphingomonas ginsenosidivorax]